MVGGSLLRAKLVEPALKKGGVTSISSHRENFIRGMYPGVNRSVLMSQLNVHFLQTEYNTIHNKQVNVS